MQWVYEYKIVYCNNLSFKYGFTAACETLQCPINYIIFIYDALHCQGLGRAAWLSLHVTSFFFFLSSVLFCDERDWYLSNCRFVHIYYNVICVYVSACVRYSDTVLTAAAWQPQYELNVGRVCSNVFVQLSFIWRASERQRQRERERESETCDAKTLYHVR